MRAKNVDKIITPRRYLAVAIIIGFVLVYDMLPFGGNIRFYSNWAGCGQKPVAGNLEWRIGGGSVKSYGESPTISLMRLYPEYFCTPLEAEEAGYSASDNFYYFPHLNKKE